MKRLIRKILPKNLHQKLHDAYYHFFAFLFCLLPIQRNKIFVINFFGADYGDNCKYIADELLKQKKYDIVWALNPECMKQNALPDGVRSVPYNSLKAVKEMQTAAVWIDNCRKVFGKKRKKQFYLQTWHAGPGLKKVERDAEDVLGKRMIRNSKRDSAMCDMIISGSDFMDRLFKESFWYSGKIARTGMPRNDVLVARDRGVVDKIRQMYGVKDGQKILLYAPTFRDSYRVDIYDLDYKAVLNALKQRFGGEWVLFARLHPNMRRQYDQLNLPDGAVNVSRHPDMQELLCAVDCLITDYSTSATDLMLSDKPGFLYVPDYDAYDCERGYNYQIADQPFPYAFDNAAMVQNILTFDGDKLFKDKGSFFERTGFAEHGDAAKNVCALIEAAIRANFK